MAAHDPPAHRNEIRLVGRLAAPAEERTLPSGDVVVTWRLVVERPPAGRVRPMRSRVDTLDCAGWHGGVRRRALCWQPGDLVELEGTLRRRFWRGAGGPASRYEVEVDAARRLRAAPVPAAVPDASA